MRRERGIVPQLVGTPSCICPSHNHPFGIGQHDVDGLTCARWPSCYANAACVCSYAAGRITCDPPGRSRSFLPPDWDRPLTALVVIIAVAVIGWCPTCCADRAHAPNATLDGA